MHVFMWCHFKLIRSYADRQQLHIKFCISFVWCVHFKWHEMCSALCFGKSRHRYHTWLRIQNKCRYEATIYTHSHMHAHTNIMHYRIDQSTRIYICIVLKLIIAFVMIYMLDWNDSKHVFCLSFCLSISWIALTFC